MASTRRAFVTETAWWTAAGGTVLTWNAWATAGEDEEAASGGYRVYSIGKVEKHEATTRIRILEPYVDGLLGLDQWSHINVFYWFDRNDVPAKRRILQVHPRGDRGNPRTGVFACRAPVRPNLIALTVCKILALENNVITVDQIDAFDATPVIDLKPFIPPDAPNQGIRVPAWAGSVRRDE